MKEILEKITRKCYCKSVFERFKCDFILTYSYLGLWIQSWVAFDIFVCIDSKSMMVSRNKSCNSLHFVFCISIMHTLYIHSGQNRPMILFEKVDGVFPHKHMCTYVINIRKVAWIQFIIVPVCLPIFRQMRHSAAASRVPSRAVCK